MLFYSVLHRLHDIVKGGLLNSYEQCRMSKSSIPSGLHGVDCQAPSDCISVQFNNIWK